MQSFSIDDNNVCYNWNVSTLFVVFIEVVRIVTPRIFEDKQKNSTFVSKIGIIINLAVFKCCV